MATRKPLPQPVIQRLPRYLTHVLELRNSGIEWASSVILAEALGLTCSTVRQDLSHLDLVGVAKRGYDTVVLEGVLRKELGTDRRHRLVVVGAGHLGRALLLDRGMWQHGFEAAGIFDVNPRTVGTRVGRFAVRPMTALKSVVRSRSVQMGIISVPAEHAQDVADRLVESGVDGILNLAYVHVRTPQRVPVIDARLLARLQELAYAIRIRKQDS